MHKDMKVQCICDFISGLSNPDLCFNLFSIVFSLYPELLSLVIQVALSTSF